MIKSYRDLNVFKASYEMAMEVFELSKSFPKEELYSLTTQIIRSSRSVSANIVEGWAKREYENVFKRHLIDAQGSCQETQNWLSFALDCNYIESDEYKRFNDKLNQIGKMLTKLHQAWKSY